MHVTKTRPHFVRDYERFVRKLLKNSEGREAAMAKAVGGGDYYSIGAAEREVLSSLGLKRGDYVIDVGCGSGRLATALENGPTVRYLGTDVVGELLAFARERCAGPDWRFEVVDGLTIPEGDGRADFVTFFSVLTHLRRREALSYLLEAKRVLKPSGRIVVSYLDPWTLPRSYLARFFCSQCLYLAFGRGVKGVLSTRSGMRKMALELGLKVQFMGPAVGQEVCVFSRGQTP
jgi:SAM-dependent methyltransferase